MSPDAAKILRAAFRVSRQIPSEVIRRKFRFNARDIVEFYSTSTDRTKATAQLATGWNVLKAFEDVLKADPALVGQLLRPFEFMVPRNNIEERG
jgi:predicted metallopeptidase